MATCLEFAPGDADYLKTVVLRLYAALKEDFIVDKGGLRLISFKHGCNVQTQKC